MGPLEILIILQPLENQAISLWWSYTPNPTRQVDTCHLANNQECDYDSGKCLMGTDCSDCEGPGCQATECTSAYRFRDQVNIPDICDDPEWKSLLPGRVNVGSKGPWDCRSLQNEMRLDCSGCRCAIEGRTHSRLPDCHVRYQPCISCEASSLDAYATTSRLSEFDMENLID